MIIKLKRSYPKLNEDGTRKLDKSGQAIIVFVYSVIGTDDELKEYEEIQTLAGVKTIKDSSGYLWFTTQPVGVKGRLKVSVNAEKGTKKLYADTTAIDLANSLVKQYGQLGMAMAKDILDKGFVADEQSAELPEKEDKSVESLD